jgi:hypothetical protein
MNEVRYFGRLVNPAPFRQGFGVWSVIIRVCDWLRTRLERVVVMSILRCELRNAGATKRQAADVLRQARLDPAFDPAAFHEMVVRAPRSLLRNMLEEASLGTSRLVRYKEERKNTPDLPPHERPIPFEQGALITFAEYERRQGARAARYVRGRKDYLVMDSDGDFYPTKGELNE